MTPLKRDHLHLVSLLTFYADDFRSVPLSVGAALGGGHVALQEAFGALVADDGVDVVVGALPADQEGVVHRGRGSAEHWRGEKARRRESGENIKKTDPRGRRTFKVEEQNCLRKLRGAENMRHFPTTPLIFCTLPRRGGGGSLVGSAGERVR